MSGRTTYATVFLDRDGTPLAVTDTVSAQGIDEGAPSWVHRGTVVGFGRTRVQVRWHDCAYELAAMNHHAVATQRRETVSVGQRKRQAMALRKVALPINETSTTL